MYLLLYLVIVLLYILAYICCQSSTYVSKFYHSINVIFSWYGICINIDLGAVDELYLNRCLVN